MASKARKVARKAIQRRIKGVSRLDTPVYLHPHVKRDLRRLARSERCSVSMMVALLIIEHWQLDES